MIPTLQLPNTGALSHWFSFVGTCSHKRVVKNRVTERQVNGERKDTAGRLVSIRDTERILGDV